MSLVAEFYNNKIVAFNKARSHPASEKFYLTQEGVWDCAYHEAKAESEALISILEAMDVDDEVIDVVRRRLLGGVEE